MDGEQGFRAKNLSLTGVVLLVVIGVGLVTRITDQTGTPKPEPAPVEIRTGEILLDSETVDLSNGNLRLQIPVPVAHQKPTAPRSDH